MRISPDAFCQLAAGSTIVVKEGATLEVLTGATLRIADWSALMVEKGGKLIIHNDANIQLWDGQDPNGNARMMVAGTLELVDGDFNFGGNGFIQFDATHEVVFNNYVSI